jgi:transposase
MKQHASTVILTPEERAELEARARSMKLRSDAVGRAKLILMLADGATYRQIRSELGFTTATTSKWKKRFLENRVDGLKSQYKGSKPTVLTPQVEAKILDWTRRPPPAGITQWSTRTLAKVLGVHYLSVARTWKRAGLQPHRMERYVRSNDPAFEEKATAIIGLYLDPPEHAVVFCVDEKTAIQALDRRDPILPMSPGRAERHGFEYVRNGTLSLYAALETKTGTVIGKTTERHTSDEFVAFLGQIVASQPVGQEIHVIADNLSAHKTPKVKAFLKENPKVSIHYTPTYSSWMNQVELWFSKIERDLIARGIFTSTKNLTEKIMNYIKHYNESAKPFRWAYSDPTKRIR